jgi:hypothetical protein
LLWSVPSILFFVGLTVWNPGHVILVLPPLFIFLAESIKGLSVDLEKGIKGIISDNRKFFQGIFSYKTILASLSTFLVLINIYVFLFKNTPVSYAAIQKNDNQLNEFIRLTKENFDPEKSMIITVSYNTQASIYLPDYLIYCPFPLVFSPSEVPITSQNVYISFRNQTTPKSYWTPTGFKIEPIVIPPGVENIILWEKKIAGYYQKQARPLMEIHSKKTDDCIFYLKTDRGEKIYYDYHHLTVK